MALLTIGDSVTGDFLRVALDGDSGKLRHCGVLAEAARGALLIDLARVGALTFTDDVNQVDTAPTGFALADELLAAISDHPDRAMQVWLQRGVPHLHEVVAELLADRYWTVERHNLIASHARYVDRDAAHYDQLRAWLIDDIAGRRHPEPREAALAALINVTGLGAPSPHLNGLPAHLLKATGDLGWIVTDVTSFLVAAQAQDQAGAIVAATTTGAQYLSI